MPPTPSTCSSRYLPRSTVPTAAWGRRGPARAAGAFIRGTNRVHVSDHGPVLRTAPCRARCAAREGRGRDRHDRPGCGARARADPGVLHRETRNRHNCIDTFAATLTLTYSPSASPDRYAWTAAWHEQEDGTRQVKTLPAKRGDV